ncbi:signal peptidase II [Nocardioides sp. BP30]|uniref:signal peptidase II n=1 Tax=Nocardioides sp. BP30 TaxID=3036374 RepID=UPI00246993C9|nr:signal peptidase II [Nocardioides sp. BP30]WGL53869.1 signal peptidase II [Nocardioides sp. BP30]
MQDARGTSLSDTRPQATTLGRSPALRLLFVAVALGAYAVDQITKALAAAHLTPGEPRHLVGALLRLDLTRNPGAAFSTGTSHTVFFTVLAIVALAVTLFVAVRAGTRLWATALGLLAAGIAGNLTDRILRAPRGFSGHVVDFLELPHWPIFNVADVCINIAALLILILAWRGVRLSGARPAAEPEDVVGGSDAPGREKPGE